ncbi:MAG: hypothetical protein ACLFTK_05680 [Anaerolineales bacterium]
MRNASLLERFYSLLTIIPEPPKRTLNAGCGLYTEADIIVRHWPDALHIGLDVNWPDLNLIRERISPVQANLQALPFRCHFDLVVVRHPDIIRRPVSWRAFFETTPAILAPKGYLLVTTYSLRERDAVRATVPLARLIIDETQLAPVNLAGQDKYPLLYTVPSS